MPTKKFKELKFMKKFPSTMLDNLARPSWKKHMYILYLVKFKLFLNQGISVTLNQKFKWAVPP